MDIDQSTKDETEVPLFWGKAVVAHGSPDFDSQNSYNCPVDQKKPKTLIGFQQSFLFLHLGRGGGHKNIRTCEEEAEQKQEAVWREMISLLFIWLGAPRFQL